MTHNVIIGGDINDNLTHAAMNIRKRYFLDFIEECNLDFSSDRKTFINSKGI